MTFKYRGYIYEFEDESEPEENCKRYHECYCEHDGIKVFSGLVPLSPYARMTEGLWERWIQAGRPTREQMGGHHPEHIDKYWTKLFDEAINNILLGQE